MVNLSNLFASDLHNEKVIILRRSDVIKVIKEKNLTECQKQCCKCWEKLNNAIGI